MNHYIKQSNLRKNGATVICRVCKERTTANRGKVCTLCLNTPKKKDHKQ